jgi:hypothetical protein
MLDTRNGDRFIKDRNTRRQSPKVLNPSRSRRRRQMEQPQWFLHMDRGWMWRWFLANDRGEPLAMSKKCFFRREDAIQNLEAARMAVIGL